LLKKALFFSIVAIILPFKFCLADLDRVTYFKKLIEKKKFSLIMNEIENTKSTVIRRWVTFVFLENQIKTYPLTNDTKNEIKSFLTLNPRHPFSYILIQQWFDKMILNGQNIETLKKEIDYVKKINQKFENSSISCIQNINSKITDIKFKKLVSNREDKKGCQALLLYGLSKKKLNTNFYILMARYAAMKKEKKFAEKILKMHKTVYGKNPIYKNELTVLAIIDQSKINSRRAFRKYLSERNRLNSEQKSFLNLQVGTALYGVTDANAWTLVKKGLNSLKQQPEENLKVVARMALRKNDLKIFNLAYKYFSDDTKNQENWKFWYAYSLKQKKKVQEFKKILLSISGNNSFYGMIASGLSEIKNRNTGLLSELNTRNLEVSSKKEWATNLDLKDILNLFKHQVFHAGLSEWRHFIRDLKDSQLIDLATYLKENKIFDRSIAAALTVDHSNSFQLKYPVAYKESILTESKKQNLPPWLILGLIRQESRFNNIIVSSAGAVGLMQILPQTAKDIMGTSKVPNLTNPKKNIRVGTVYLKRLMKKFKSVPLTLAAYNAGPSRAKKWYKDKVSGKNLSSAMFIESIPYKETREYVKTVIFGASMYSMILKKNEKQHQSTDFVKLLGRLDQQ
jgi:soluble lytic murein transglycosylase-like protein